MSMERVSPLAPEPEKYLITIEEALANFPFYEIPIDCRKQVLNGIKLHFDDIPNETFVATINGKAVGIAENSNGKLSFKLRL